MSDGPEYIRTEVDNGVRATPVVATPMVTSVPVAPVVAPTAPMVRTSYTRRFAPDAIVAAVVGLVLLLVGLIAMTRGGFDGSMDVPVVKVLGFTHTTLLGIIETAIGACLLISGASRARSGALFFGSLLGIGGFVGAVQTSSFRKPLALESGLSWLFVLGGVIVVVCALLLPRVLTRSTVVQPL